MGLCNNSFMVDMLLWKGYVVGFDRLFCVVEMVLCCDSYDMLLVIGGFVVFDDQVIVLY